MSKNSIFVVAFATTSVFLAVYLLGSFSRRQKDTRDHVTCQNNLRQIGQAVQMYVADNDGFLPSEDLWFYKAIPSLPRSGCPAAEPIPRLAPPLVGTGRGLLGYAFNAMLAGESAYIAGRFSRTQLVYLALTHPQTTIVIFDYVPGIPTTVVLNIYGDRSGGCQNSYRKAGSGIVAGGITCSATGTLAGFLSHKSLSLNRTSAMATRPALTSVWTNGQPQMGENRRFFEAF